MASELRMDLLRWQEEVLQDKTRFKVICAGRRLGKTRFAIVQSIIKALECKDVSASVMLIAPTFGMARNLHWDTLLYLAQPVVVSSNVNNGEIKLVNGVKICVRGSDNPDSLRGIKLYHVTLDEFQSTKDKTWEYVVRPALSDMKGTALFIGTPMLDAESFREMFDHGMSGEDPEWKSWLFKTIDNELIDPKEVEAAKRTLSTLAYLQEYEAEWVTMGANVFKMEWFKTAPAPSGKEYSTYIAVDPAGFEDVAKLGIDDKKRKYLDYTAIAIVRVYDDGKWWVQAIHHGRWDVRETATRILLAVRTHKPVCVGIEKGSLRRAIMPYLTDLMRKNNVYAHIEDIATSGSNKVDRIVYALQGLMEHGRITFNVDEDWAELKREMMGFPSQKVHDDLCFPAETPIITVDGVKKIIEITTDDYVLTRNGYKKVVKAWCSGNKEVVTRFGITATPNHKIHTENRGWVSLDSLCMNDILLEASPIEETSCENQLLSMAGLTTDTQTQNSQTTENTTHHTQHGEQPHNFSTEIFGSSTTAQSLKDTTSTTGTEMQTTMKSETLSACPMPHIKWNTEKKEAQERNLPNIWNTSLIFEIAQKHGMRHQKGGSGTDSTHFDPSQKIGPKNHAKSVEKCSNQKWQEHQCVAPNVSASESMSNKEQGGRIPTYDLTVEGEAEFFAWGVLVHNCDALSMVSHLNSTIYGNKNDDTKEWQPVDLVAGI